MHIYRPRRAPSGAGEVGAAEGPVAGGTAGAVRVLEILLAEFDTALALSGALRADAVDRRFIAPRLRVGPGS